MASQSKKMTGIWPKMADFEGKNDIARSIQKIRSFSNFLLQIPLDLA